MCSTRHAPLSIRSSTIWDTEVYWDAILMQDILQAPGVTTLIKQGVGRGNHTFFVSAAAPGRSSVAIVVHQ